MDETLFVLRNTHTNNINNNVNETSLPKSVDDPKYFIIAITSLVVFFLISIITTVLLCITLKNEPILWDIDAEKPGDTGDGCIAGEVPELSENIDDEHLDIENNI